MPSHKLPNYLNTFRRKSGLSQNELAYLLGCKSGSKISRYEKSVNVPRFDALLGYEFLFSAPPSQLYAGAFEQRREQIVERVRSLRDSLAASPSTPRKEKTSKILFLDKLLSTVKQQP